MHVLVVALLSAAVQSDVCTELDGRSYPPLAVVGTDGNDGADVYLTIGVVRDVGKFADIHLNYCRALTLWAEKVAAGIASPGHKGDARHKPSVTGVTFTLQDFDEAVGEADAPTSVETAVQKLMQSEVEVLIAPYSSGLTARAAVAVSKTAAAQFAALGGGDSVVEGEGEGEVGDVALWPKVPTMLSAGAAAESIYTCDARMEYPCSRPFGRRFRNVFTLLSPGATYFQGLAELAAAQDAAGIALLYETGGYSGNPFSKSVSNGVRAHAAKLNVNILIEIGVRIDAEADETTVSVVADDDVAAAAAAAGGTLDTPTTTKGRYPRLVVTAPDQASAAAAVASTLGPVVLADANKVLNVGGSGRTHGGVVVAAVTQKEISCELLLAALASQGVAPAAIGLTVCSTKPNFPALLQSWNTSFVTGPSQWDAKLRGPDYEESAARSPVYHFASEAGVPSPNQFENEFEERWDGVAPTYHTAAVMAAVYALEDAVKATGAFSLSELGLALHNVRMPSFWGALHFSTLGVVEARAMVTYQYDFDHEARIVAPAAASNMPFVYPIPTRFDVCPPGWESNPNTGRGKGDAYACKDEGEDAAAATAAVGNSSSSSSSSSSTLLNWYSGFCASACRPCQAGTISTTAGSTCSTCPVASVQLLAGKSACNECGLNYESNVDFTECDECRPGWQRPRSQGVCTEAGAELRERSNLVGGVLGGVIALITLFGTAVLLRYHFSANGPEQFYTQLKDLEREGVVAEDAGGAGKDGGDAGGGAGGSGRGRGGNASVKLKRPKEIANTKLRLVSQIGEGQFGVVHLAVLTGSRREGTVDVKVAVKTALESADADDRKQLLAEAAVMAQFNHPNVLGLVGVVTRNQLCRLIMQYCTFGSLDKLLKDEVLFPDGVKEQMGLALQMATDILAGMVYLSDRRFVHRDLATRNILLNADMVSVIGDFGMSRALGDTKQYVMRAGLMPIRWSAPEVLTDAKYSPASDVYSFGILVHEIFTLAREPFFGISNVEVVATVTAPLKPSGSKVDYLPLDQPKDCPTPIYEHFMLACWEPFLEDRPTFSMLYSYGNDVLAEHLHGARVNSNALLDTLTHLEEEAGEASRRQTLVEEEMVEAAELATEAALLAAGQEGRSPPLASLDRITTAHLEDLADKAVRRENSATAQGAAGGRTMFFHQPYSSVAVVRGMAAGVIDVDTDEDESANSSSAEVFDPERSSTASIKSKRSSAGELNPYVDVETISGGSAEINAGSKRTASDADKTTATPSASSVVSIV